MKLRTLNRDEAKFKKYSSETLIRLSNLSILFLNRLVGELTTYIRQHLLASFEKKPLRDEPSYPQEEEEFKIEQEIPEEDEETHRKMNSEPIRSDSKLSLLILDSDIKVPRNSISQEHLLFKSEKLSLWSIGKWGTLPGQLINTKKFAFEINTAASESQNTQNLDEFLQRSGGL